MWQLSKMFYQFMTYYLSVYRYTYLISNKKFILSVRIDVSDGAYVAS